MIMMGLQRALDLDDYEAMDFISPELPCSSRGLLSGASAEGREEEAEEDDYLIRI